MTGTIFNIFTILLGSALGLLFRRGLPEKIERIAMQMAGTGVAIIGANGIASTMFSVDLTTGKLVESGSMLLVISLVVGGCLGEWIDIDARVNAFGKRIEQKLGKEGFAKGFVTASLLYCVGAMAILGPISDGLYGDSSILFVKAVLDGMISVILAATLGFGVAFSAVSVLVYQGAISMAAGMLSSLLQGQLLNDICMVGYCLVLLLGLGQIGIVKIRTANLLPAMLLPIVYNFLMMLKNI